MWLQAGPRISLSTGRVRCHSVSLCRMTMCWRSSDVPETSYRSSSVHCWRWTLQARSRCDHFCEPPSPNDGLYLVVIDVWWCDRSWWFVRLPAWRRAVFADRVASECASAKHSRDPAGNLWVNETLRVCVVVLMPFFLVEHFSSQSMPFLGCFQQLKTSFHVSRTCVTSAIGISIANHELYSRSLPKMPAEPHGIATSIVTSRDGRSNIGSG